MTDPVGVTADPRPVLMMGDEPDTVAELMALADRYAVDAFNGQSFTRAFCGHHRDKLEAAIRAALEAQ